MTEADDEVETAAERDEPFTGKTSPAKRWLNLIAEQEAAFRDWQSKVDSIDKLYANIKTLAAADRDREFQMFWANIQVLGPSIYSRPPVPVVVPRFKDRRPVPRMASELLERCTVVGFELEDIDEIMRHVRDDLTIAARGAAWVRYDTKDGQKVCIDFADRKDFLHGPGRTWKEVPWVAKRSWLTKSQMRKRFKDSSGDAYQTATYEERKDEDDKDTALKAGVWELWSKDKNKVVWVSEGVEVLLDEDKPHLKLDGFFPCPRPAYDTLQRRTLMPVPGMLFYKDQLEEINELTARIGALSQALQVKGFYPAGAGEIGDAIETALKATANNVFLVPISNWAAFGNGAAKDTIVWLPTAEVATTIVQLVELRKQLIADVYEITGLSDIMRGSTDPNETLGAQELKGQYGSVRIRDRQNELVRFARDLVRISAEIMAENFSAETMLDMSQLEIATDADIAKQQKALEAQIKAIIDQVENAKADPQMMAQAQQNPEAAQKMLSQAKQQAEGLKARHDKLNDTPTIEKVLKLLRDQRLRPFTLDIETDSTIQPDENAQKQRATEFMTALGGYMSQVMPLMQAAPESAPLAAEGLRYVASQFRAGRMMEQTIEEFADQMKAMAGQPKPPNPETIKAQGEAKAAEANAMKAQGEAAEKQANAQKSLIEAQSKAADDELQRKLKEIQEQDAAKDRAIERAGKIRLMDAEFEQKGLQHLQAMDIGNLQLEKLRLEINGVKVKTASTVATTEAKIDQTETQTDNAIRTTDANVSATAEKTEMAREAAKEPA